MNQDKKNHRLQLTGYIVLSVVSLCLAYPNGAPDAACASMRPSHPGSPAPQVTPAPFEIKVSQNTVMAGRPVQVTLDTKTNGLRFTGFLLRAVRSNQNNRALGSFNNRNDARVKNLVCAENTISITHTSNEAKSQIQVDWIPPQSFSGDVFFVATVVQNVATFWEGIVSETIFVSNSQTDPDFPFNPTSPATGGFGQPTTMRNGAMTESMKIYDGCSTTKGCFGPVDGCVANRNCPYVATHRIEGNNVIVELQRNGPGYVALGFSKDNKMGADSVVHCLSGQRQGFVSQNIINGKNNNVQIDQSPVLSSSVTFKDGNLYCVVKRTSTDDVSGISYDLIRDKVFLLLAEGDQTSNPLSIHREKTFSTESKMLSDMGTTGAASSNRALLAAHGSLMIISWVGCVSIAVFFARYYKPQWPNSTLLGQKVWFTWHRSLNGLAVACASAAFVLVFIYVRDISSEWRTNPHPTLGIVVMTLTLCQLIMALLRPHPGTPKRPLFNWAHFLLGNILLLASHVTLYFAQPMGASRLPKYYWWILISFDVFYVVMFMVMEMFTYMDSNRTKVGTQIAMKEMMNGNHFMTHSEPENRSGPFRNVMLVLFVCGVFAFSVALVVTVVTHTAS